MGYLQEKKKALMNSVVSGGLPSEYQEVDYIENTSGSYLIINTYVLETDYVESECSVNEVRYASDKYVVCSYPWNSPTGSRFAFGLYLNKYTIGFGTSGTDSTALLPSTSNDGNVHKWIYSNKFCEIPDLEIQRGLSSIFYANSTSKTIRLFWGYNNVTKGRVKTFIQKRDDEEIVNLIPCYRKSDNEVGMYDLINNVFYINQGSGQFTYGSEV